MSNEEQNVTENTTTAGETKKCKYCQSDIPKKAKVCPVCKKKQKKNIVLIIILAFVILSFTMCGTMCGIFGKAVNDVAEEEQKKDDAIKELTKKKYKVGETVATDDFKVKYISVKDYKSKNEFMQPKKGKKFIKLEFEFENKSKEDDLYVSSGDFNCTADDYDCERQYFDNLELDAQLAPGKKTKGCVFFEVPKKAKSIVVKYNISFWENHKLTFVAK